MIERFKEEALSKINATGRIAAGGLLIAGCAGSDGEENPPAEAHNTPTPIVEPSPFPSPTETIVFDNTTATNATNEQTPPSGEEIFYKGIDLMNQIKDRVFNPRSQEEQQLLIDYAQQLGVTHVALTTPYDYYTSESGELRELEEVDELTEQWVETIRNAGLSVSHRHMFMNFEGIYDEEKVTNQAMQERFGTDYIDLMREWMIENQDLIQPGDTWTPMPEPQNGGRCPDENECVFADNREFNQFIRDAVIASRETLEELGKYDVKVICCGFDGFIAWGDNNPDWIGKGVLEKETVETLGHIAIDHNPQDGATFEEDLQELYDTWPGVDIYITEMGIADARNPQMIVQRYQLFAEDPLVKGVWYWQLGPSSEEKESLLVGPEHHETILTSENTYPSESFDHVREGIEQLP